MNFELTQSSLKDWINTENKEDWYKKWILKERVFEYNTSFIYGSLLDGFLFEPENLSKRFASYKGKCKPTDAIQAIVGLMSKTYNKSKPLRDQLLIAAKTLKYGGNWKDDTIMNRLEGLDDYIEFCIKNKNKTVVLESYAKEIRDVANYLVKHYDSDIYKYIVANPSEDYVNKFQQTLKGNINGVECKIILDILHYDEINSTVRDVDFKTTYDIEKFKDSIYKYGYDTQVSFYQEILEQNPKVYDGYTLLLPMNIAVAKRDLEIYTHYYAENILDEAKYGQWDQKGWLHYVNEIGDFLKTIK